MKQGNGGRRMGGLALYSADWRLLICRRPTISQCTMRLSLSIFFNGEIYNFSDLRYELIFMGHCISSHTDTDVILAAYREGRCGMSGVIQWHVCLCAV
jgi:glutamine phosphoribosylpyrophosphate amidotransferase